jgi:hypothetical protein
MTSRKGPVEGNPGGKFALPQLGAGPIWLYNAGSLAEAPLTEAGATRQASIPVS